jgi:sigma-B regulation protein RsbU (phosphoserine phosphatase)
MDKVELLTPIESDKSFSDVLYLTNQDNIPSSIKKLLKKRKLSYRVLPIDKFLTVRDRLDLIGTVIIDTKDSNSSQQHQLARIIESLEMENIGMILLTDRQETPVKSFSLSPTKTSFSMVKSIESISIEELWAKISANLAYRKKSTGITTKPLVQRRHVLRIHRNKLAEQLSMTKSLADNLAEQLRLAGLVQQDFLPTELPDTDEVQWVSIFIPAEWVSGDIYDVLRIDEQHIGFYVADVVGHGMPAALLTIFLKQALVMRETYEKNYRIFSPAEVIQNLNVRMAAQKLSGYQFATCCYCLVDTQTFNVTCARAGHPYPVLIRRNKQPELIEMRGSLLGIFESAEYVQNRIQMEPGDKLLLYSDGLEAFVGRIDDRKGFAFSEEFLKIKDLPIDEMFAKISSKLKRRNGDMALSEIDDCTLVGLEIR